VSHWALVHDGDSCGVCIAVAPVFLFASQVMSELNDHISDEETRILPIFEKNCPRDKAASILSSYQNAVVTTLPHVRHTSHTRNACGTMRSEAKVWPSVR
jgi:hypothetical protein